MAQQLTVLVVLPEVLMPYSGPRAQAHTHTEMNINKNKSTVPAIVADL